MPGATIRRASINSGDRRGLLKQFLQKPFGAPLRGNRAVRVLHSHQTGSGQRLAERCSSTQLDALDLGRRGGDDCLRKAHPRRLGEASPDRPGSLSVHIYEPAQGGAALGEQHAFGGEAIDAWTAEFGEGWYASPVLVTALVGGVGEALVAAFRGSPIEVITAFNLLPPPVQAVVIVLLSRAVAAQFLGRPRTG